MGEKIRTPDLLVRSQTLYPAELRPHIIALLQQQYVLYMTICQMSIQKFKNKKMKNFIDFGE